MGDKTGDCLGREEKPEKHGWMWVVVGGREVFGEGRVSTGGIWNPVVAGAQVPEVGGVGSWEARAVRAGSKAGGWDGVRRRER